MILVTGAVIARPETLCEVQRLCLEHVARSRVEPGCISHDVHVDCDNPLRLVFVEQWTDVAALQAHFALSESVVFVRAIRKLCGESGQLDVYDATPLDVAV